MGRTTKLLYEGIFGHSEMVGFADVNIRCAMLKITIFVGIFMTIAFSSYTYDKTGNILEYLSRLSIILFFIAGFIVMGKGRARLFISSLLVLIPLFYTFISMFFVGGSGLFQGLWVLCVPLIAIVSGIELAIASCLVIFIVMLAICFVPGFALQDYPSETSFRYLGVYVTNCIFAFAYVISKNKLRQEFVKELKALGQIDSLTGVLNRRGFQLYAEELWKQAKMEKSSLSFVIIDICNFKRINDDYGYQNGDSFLIKCVNIIKRNVVNPLDLITRSGGKELGILLFNTKQEQAQQVADKIKSSIEKEAIPMLGSELSDMYVLVGVTSIDFSEKSKKYKDLYEMFVSAGQNIQKINQ
jgi:diguanylate cyclase (GGDEF)-like protein